MQNQQFIFIYQNYMKITIMFKVLNNCRQRLQLETCPFVYSSFLHSSLTFIAQSRIFKWLKILLMVMVENGEWRMQDGQRMAK